MTCQATSEAKRLRGGIATRRTWDAIEFCRPSLSAASIGEQHMHTASSLISQPARIDDSCHGTEFCCGLPPESASYTRRQRKK